MGIRFCPRCQNSFVFDDNCEDIVHQCGDTTASEVLINEDVVVVGKWEDFTGSGTPTNIMMQGITNDIWGTRGAIEGEKVGTTTSRGNDAATHRVRKHLEFIKLK